MNFLKKAFIPGLAEAEKPSEMTEAILDDSEYERMMFAPPTSKRTVRPKRVVIDGEESEIPLSDDFGFKLMSDDEMIDESVVNEYRDKLKSMYDLIIPLIRNLQKDPDKEVIKWPGRYHKMVALEDRIHEIFNPNG